MNSSVLMSVAGAVGLFWLRWYVPKAMARLGQLLTARGQPTERFEKMLLSRRYRTIIGVMTVGCIAAIGFGVVSLLVG